MNHQKIKQIILGTKIVFEGPDTTGKTTVAKKIKAWLESLGYRVEFVRQPGYTQVGEEIRKLILSGEYQYDDITKRVLYAANHQALISEIYDNGRDDTIYICDRYVPVSNLAIGGYGDGIDLNYIKNLTDISPYKQYPNLIMIYDISEKSMLQRLRKREQEMGEVNFYDVKGMDFRNRVRAGYKELINLLSDEEKEVTRYISAEGNEEEVFQRTQKLIIETFQV